MFPTFSNYKNEGEEMERRNPLKSGQCFLLKVLLESKEVPLDAQQSQSPQIGSMFPTKI